MTGVIDRFSRKGKLVLVAGASIGLDTHFAQVPAADGAHLVGSP